MKKIIIGVITAGILVFVLALIEMYAVYNISFPKAEKFDYPDFSMVESITVLKYRETIPTSQEDCEMLYQYISKAKPTRKMSVHDTPLVTPFYTVVIESEALPHFSYGYVYKERGRAYFEIPYVGVYKLDADAFAYIKDAGI